MQTLLVLHADDLTGTNVLSNKPLMVISGHECAYAILNYNDIVMCFCVLIPSCEPQALQVPLTTTWGTRFLIAGQLSLQQIWEHKQCHI